MGIKKITKLKVSKTEVDLYSEILEELSAKKSSGELIGSDGLSSSATPLDKMKWDICREIIIFKRVTNSTSKKISELMEVNKSRVSEILHYRVDQFTIDRLLGCLLSLKGLNSLTDKKIEGLFSALSIDQFAS